MSASRESYILDAGSDSLCSIVNTIFDASLVYECLTSVPFNPAVASRFIAYYNDTLQFHGTLAYLRAPPPSYQQPAVDLMSGLAWVQSRIDNGSFANQHEFEAALQTLLAAAHDGRLCLNAGILSAFAFFSPFNIVSVSVDGIQLPKVYIESELYPFLIVVEMPEQPS